MRYSSGSSRAGGMFKPVRRKSNRSGRSQSVRNSIVFGIQTRKSPGTCAKRYQVVVADDGHPGTVDPRTRVLAFASNSKGFEHVFVSVPCVTPGIRILRSVLGSGDVQWDSLFASRLISISG